MTRNHAAIQQDQRVLTMVGSDFQHASVDLRERLSFGGERLEASLDALRKRFAEAVILSTCNRVEIYALVETTSATDAVAQVQGFLAEVSGALPAEIRDATRARTGEDVVRHAFRVASGLESMVLGEPQILGQVRDALHAARSRGSAGPVLGRLLTDALRIGKQARTRTDIARNKTSIAHAAVALAAREFASGCPILVALDRDDTERVPCPAPLAQRVALRDRTAVVVGAGPMAELSAKLFRAGGVRRLLIVNRTRDRAESLAARTGGEAVSYDRLPEALAMADVGIAAVGAREPIVQPHHLRERERLGRGPLLLIDVGVPRCVSPDVQTLPSVRLHDVDALESIASSFRTEHATEIIHVEHLVSDGVATFMTWEANRHITPIITAIRAEADAICAQELEKALAKLGHLSERDRQVVAALATGITNKVLHGPTARLTACDNPDRVSEAGVIARAFGVPGGQIAAAGHHAEESSRPASICPVRPAAAD